MINRKLLGMQAETAACRFLQRQGLQLVAQNYRCRFGEIDLIMRECETLVFAEVRYRVLQHYGSSAETVTCSKQRKIIKTADYYLLQHALNNFTACRFDVLALTPKRLGFGYSIEWIKDAFQVPYF